MSDTSPSPADEFASELRGLYDAAGRPPYRALIAHGQMQDPAVRLHAQSLSDWLAGKSVPKASPAARFLIVHLEARARRQAQARGEDYQPRGIEGWMRLRNRAWDHTHANRPSRASAPGRTSSSRPPVAPATTEQPPRSGPAGLPAPQAVPAAARAAAALASGRQITHQPPPEAAALQSPPAAPGASSRSIGRLLRPPRRPRTPRTIAIRIATALIGAFVLVQLLASQPLHQDGAPTPPTSNRPPDRVRPTPVPRPLLLELRWAGSNGNLCGPVARIYPSRNALLHMIHQEPSRLDDYDQSIDEVSFLMKSTSVAPLTVHQVGVRVLRVTPATGVRAYPRPKRRSYCAAARGLRIAVDLTQAPPGLRAFKALNVSRTGTSHLQVLVVNPYPGMSDYEWQIVVSWSAPSDAPGTRRWTAMPHRFRTSTTPLHSYTNDGQVRTEDPGSL